jgi:hypothetical protein
MATIIFCWFFLSVAAGMFADIRRNRNGGGWFFLAILFSPLVAFVLLLILQPLPKKMTRRQMLDRLAVLRAQEAEAARKVDPRWADLHS